MYYVADIRSISSLCRCDAQLVHVNQIHPNLPFAYFFFNKTHPVDAIRDPVTTTAAKKNTVPPQICA